MNIVFTGSVYTILVNVVNGLVSNVNRCCHSIRFVTSSVIGLAGHCLQNY